MGLNALCRYAIPPVLPVFTSRPNLSLWPRRIKSGVRHGVVPWRPWAAGSALPVGRAMTPPPRAIVNIRSFVARGPRVGPGRCLNAGCHRPSSLTPSATRLRYIQGSVLCMRSGETRPVRCRGQRPFSTEVTSKKTANERVAAATAPAAQLGLARSFRSDWTSRR